MPPERKSDESDLALLAHALRRRIWVIALACAACTAVAVLFTLRAQEEYSATASLLLRPATEIEPQRVIETNLQLLSLPALSEKTADKVKGVSKAEVQEAIESGQQGESDIVEVKATATSPDLAALLANVFAEEFIKFREGNKTQTAQPGEVELVERAAANDDPVAPNAVQNVVFGALIGIVLGFGLALLLEQLDRRVTRQQQVLDATGLPVLAQIPKRRGFELANLAGGKISAAELEVFQLLRANLRYYDVREPIRSILITSASVGEGKTVVTLGLAAAAAASGERVLVIEADLRNPKLGQILGGRSRQGLSAGLSGGKMSLDDLVMPLNAGDIAPSASGHRVDVIPSGAVPPNPVELIESQRMRDLLTQAEAEYDLIVIDTPPVLLASEAIPLMSAVSGVIAVSGLGVSTRALASELAAQLDRVHAPVLGLIVNFATHTGRSFEGYGRPPELASNGAAPAPQPRRQQRGRRDRKRAKSAEQ